MRVLGFGTYESARHPRVSILLRGLADLGVDVCELNEPLDFSTSERVAMMHQPWRTPRLAVRLGHRWTTLTLRRLRRDWADTRPGNDRANTPDALLVGYMGHLDVILARLLFPRTPIALDMLVFAGDTALDRGEARGLKVRLMSALDHVATRLATIVVVDTPESIELVAHSQRHKVVVAPVGASEEWFRDRRGDMTKHQRSGPLSIIFFGLFTPLQGTPTIGAALALLTRAHEARITMVGTGQDYARTRELAAGCPNVTYVDWVEPEDLPRLVHDHDVCLGIFADTPKSLRVVPNKVFEGAAAGCAIVTSDTPAQRRALAETAIYVSPSDPPALARALDHLIAHSDLATRHGQLAAELADQTFRPHHVAEPLLRTFKELS